MATRRNVTRMAITAVLAAVLAGCGPSKGEATGSEADKAAAQSVQGGASSPAEPSASSSNPTTDQGLRNAKPDEAGDRN